MNTLSIRTIGIALPDDIEQQLVSAGFEMWQASASQPWLTLINLSRCDPCEVTGQLADHQAGNLVALLAPEQSELAAAAMQAGAQDYLLLPVIGESLFALVNRLRRLDQPDTSLVVAAAVSRQLLMLAHRAAATEASVLLSGESGTGKEPLAHYIHRHSSRANKAFVAINCAAIPESMLESVLFGHVKGAFTGALSDKAGKFEQANGGTLLLDEIGEMPLLLQAKLLRVLQEREVERLGGHQLIRLNIRLIASTNKDLRKAVEMGTFREDLFYRLDVLPLTILPLRERKADILPLAEHFLCLYDTPSSSASCYFSEPAKQLLMAHDWPGNVRELENCIQRALVMRRGQAIQAAELGLAVEQLMPPESADSGDGLKASKRQAEFQYIVDILKRFNGNRNQSADALGMTTRALRYKLAQMRESGIDVDQLLQRAGQAA
jgi:DNA-binding NtrC family response regulator